MSSKTTRDSRSRTVFANPLLFGVLVLVQSSCGGTQDQAATSPSTTAAPDTKPPAPAEAAASAPAPAAAAATPAAPPHWTYEGAEGPERWGELDPKFAACKEGKKQSPIDVSGKAPVDKKLSAIAFSYKPIPLQIINNGHTVQVDNTAESFITIGADRYDLLQFHFHSPAEHTIDGKRYDMELHLVHKSSAGNYAVVGMVLKKGKDAAAFKPFFDNMPMKKTAEPQTVSGASVDLTPLLPKKGAYFSYPGSLTAPPCTEGVSWFVLVNPGEVAEALVTKFQSATGGATNRPVQPPNGRVPAQFKP